MTDKELPLILCVDDDPNILKLLERYLIPAGYRVLPESDPQKGLASARSRKPDLILLDLMMPVVSGYQFCERLQEDQKTALIPVLVLTASGGQEDRKKAISCGAADFLEKPIKREILLAKIEVCLKAGKQWYSLPLEAVVWDAVISPAQYLAFKDWLGEKYKISGDKRELLSSLPPDEIYLLSETGALSASELARAMAEYLKLEYLTQIDPEKIKLGVLPPAFSRRNQIVAMSGDPRQVIFLVANPFNVELITLLESFGKTGQRAALAVTEPAKIKLLFEAQARNDEGASDPSQSGQVVTKREKIEVAKLTQEQVEKYPVMHIANNILYSAVEERASDIHIEPKEENTLVRFRVDGDMREMFKLKKKTGDMLISRFKAMSGLDIAERRRPQDGGLEASISERSFKMRMATSSTPDGESLVIRMLEPSVKPALLSELGMTARQSEAMKDLASRTHGVVLIVGPTGSGKTTTIYSFLSQIDTKSRSLITVEDPVEYRIPYANQQQVNEKAGVTFESLLKSAVRQDPDIMFLGEIRDPYSAKMALDFASSGHLTISTIHSSNA
ncbi:MAG: ATPase, T2SS/T4P/T4SS family, partial [bacterium]|nr:ATPase, T2SS/T4P/T4SS family [bacterium]